MGGIFGASVATRFQGSTAAACENEGEVVVIVAVAVTDA